MLAAHEQPNVMESLNQPHNARAVRVLVLSRSYPNPATELLGLWVQGLVRQSTQFCEPKVISPVPYCPPIPGLPVTYSRFRPVPRRRWDGAVEVHHPRLLVGPGYSTHRVEWLLYYAAVRNCVDRVRKTFPFDLIHAHFTYPDGVVAAHLGRRYGVPVIITEQNPWGPWMERYPSVRRRAIWAVQRSVRQIAISQSVRKTIENFAGRVEHLRVIPDGVDGSIFRLRENGQHRVAGQMLFVGAVRPVKGVDVLLQAMKLLADRGRGVTLLVAGEPYFEAYRREATRLQEVTRQLQLQDRVRFIGKQPLSELVRLMQESAMLVLPSRAESLGMVLVEALACGTPVVATRCGGPEDIVNDHVGVLVPPEDPEALADGIERVLDGNGSYDPGSLRDHALANFGLESVGNRLADLYSEVVREFAARAAR